MRLGKRIDAVILSERSIIVLEFKKEQDDASARRQVEDYALDLFHFHTRSREHPIIPVLVTGGAPKLLPALPLFLGVIKPVLVVHPADLPALLSDLVERTPVPSTPLLSSAWLAGTYAPVPTIVEAACMAFARHGVAEIAEARADRRNLRETTAAIWSTVAAARRLGRHTCLFVTGIPGAGKTLCGLNAAFAPEPSLRGTFLTGNPTLVHVFREALIRDGVKQGRDRRKISADMVSVIQRLPDFRTKYLVDETEAPPEPVIVIDEAQRCWSRDYAVRKTRDKTHPLSDSEPGHLLDFMARRRDFAVIVCMVGNGQEIHDGEGGLAEWGAALRARPDWDVVAAPDTTDSADPRQCLGSLPRLRHESALHLVVPIRQIGSDAAARWVDAMLGGHPDAASAIARQAGSIPFHLTRSLDTLRLALRSAARGMRRAGLVSSSGAARLRAEGLGAELPHMDAQAVAHWFLDHFPDDVRASDALEQVATEFGVQGLELDYVGLCWDADFIRSSSQITWLSRRFVGTRWQTIRSAEAISNQINTYRVLLTRARYDTIIFVPRGNRADPTRDPDIYDQIADYLSRCGVSVVNGDGALAKPIEPQKPIPAPTRLL